MTFDELIKSLLSELFCDDRPDSVQCRRIFERVFAGGDGI